LIGLYSSEKGVEKLRAKINTLERKNPKYAYCKTQLEQYQPDLIFCTTQRATQSISALLAAKDLGIPTVAFVYSWDNVPKAMQVVETDYYCVWSEHMKREVLQYYSFVKPEQIFVTGTPQFEPHYDHSLKETREDFFKQYGLDVNKQYICYSGDDETTSPLDQYYLEDLANAVRTGFVGLEVTHVNWQEDRYPVRVIYPESLRKDSAGLSTLPLTLSSSAMDCGRMLSSNSSDL
jgi:hypothetical protein